MASPQKEKGFTPIAHEILEQISKISLNGTQFRIIMVVWRYTYGFNRKRHDLSETFLSKAIGTSRPTISRELKVLFDMKILIVFERPTFNTPAVIGFNKNYEEWQHLSNTSTGIELDTSTGIELDTSTGIELDTQERKVKEILKKEVFFENEKLDTIFNDFLNLRKKIKAVNSERAIKSLLKILNNYDDKTKFAMINKSIVNSWKGIFELKVNDLDVFSDDAQWQENKNDEGDYKSCQL